MDAKDAREYFEALGADLLAGNVFAMLERAALPVAIYFPDNTLIFRDRALILRGLLAYSRALRAQGVARCTVVFASVEGETEAVARVRIEDVYSRADGSEVGRGRATYFLSGPKGEEKVTVIEIDALPLPASALPFDPAEFE